MLQMKKSIGINNAPLPKQIFALQAFEDGISLLLFSKLGRDVKGHGLVNQLIVICEIVNSA